MKKFIFALVILALAVLFIASNARPTQAQSGGGYALTWNTFDDSGGAMFSAGGAYSLGGTMGQADAGMLSGGSYALSGGFWIDFLGNRINLPLLVR